MRVAAVLGLAASGCSLIFVRTPEPLPPGDPPTCTSSRGLPIVDAFLGAAFIGLAAATYFAVDNRNNDVDLRALGAVVVGSAAIPFLFSVHHGVRATGRCRTQEAAFAQYQAEYQREQAAPPQHLGRANEACWPDGTCDPGLGCTAGRCAAP